MARRTAQVTSHENGSSGDERNQGIPAGAIAVPGQTPPADPSVLGCPINKCDGRLRADASGYDSRTGLEPMVCTRCGHRGFRSQEGVILLFRGGYEFKFSYGPSVQTITIVLSSAAVNLWSTHDVTDDQLAKIAAEWALLCGHTSRQVHLGIPAEEFADFYLYFCKQ
ncbi:MAG: hypothetical protein HY348_04075 [Nitrospira defluvii]|nr:hypothetical protein [Nitrospira defluvii]